MNNTTMIFVSLNKIKTRKDAECPQEKKYPSGNTISMGFMKKGHEPTVGSPFFVFQDKVIPNFRTSTVVEILEHTDLNIMFKTKNSVYDVIIKKSI